MNLILIPSILIIGLSGIIAQVIILRELLVSFYGNELILGVILGNWVLSEALGALFMGRNIDKAENKIDIFAVLQVIFSLALPLSIYASRVFKGFIGIPFGEAISLPGIWLSSFLIIFPSAFSHGGLFSFLCKISGIARAYVWETLGTIAGGLILTYLLIPFLNSFQVVFIVSFANLLLPLFFIRNVGPGSLRFLTVAVFLSLAYLILNGAPDYLHRLSITKQWKGQEVLDYRNSVYGNIAVTKSRGQYTFFSNGVPIIATPYPDITFVEEFGHFPLLLHANPKYVLVISAGAGGLINEILKHPVTKVDYVELDPLLIGMLKKYPTALTLKEFGDTRVNVINSDGRFFLKEAPDKYDLIFIGLSRPADLLANRLFTQEFFSSAGKKLNPGGILALHLPGSLVYISGQLRDLNFSILNGLNNVYRYVRIIPGDYNIFLASFSPGVIEATSQSVSRKILEGNITTNLLLPDYLDYRLNPYWADWFNLSARGATSKANRDLAPFALFKTMLFWNKQFSPQVMRVFEFFETLNISAVCLFIVLFTLAFFYFFRPNKREAIRAWISYAIFTSGFFGMLISLLLIFSFQVFYGYLYKMIGILMSIFMAGVAAGSFFITPRAEKMKNVARFFVSFEIIISAFTLLLALILSLWGKFIGRAPLIYVGLFFIPGFFLGAEFPLAGRIYSAKKEETGKTAGRLYFSDLLGGWLAGMLGGVLFLPLFGLFNTCIIIAFWKLSSTLLFLPILSKIF